MGCGADVKKNKCAVQSVLLMDTANVRPCPCSIWKHVLCESSVIFSIVLCPVPFFRSLAPYPVAESHPSCLSVLLYDIPQGRAIHREQPDALPRRLRQGVPKMSRQDGQHPLE